MWLIIIIRWFQIYKLVSRLNGNKSADEFTDSNELVFTNWFEKDKITKCETCKTTEGDIQDFTSEESS